MRGTRSVFTLAAVLCLTAPAAAQQQTEPQYVLAAYYRCNVNGQARADSIWQRLNAPALSRAQQAGTISGFGLSAHRHGGAWRRLEYFVGNDIATLYRVQEEVGDAVGAEGAEFTAICGSHDDYLWQQRLTGPGDAGTPTAPVFSISIYYECQPQNEARADEIVERVIAPILNRHASAGHMTSWSWLEHVIGGPYRRALVMRAPDLEGVLAVTAMVSADAQATAEFAQFSSICGRHTDYIWSPVAVN